MDGKTIYIVDDGYPGIGQSAAGIGKEDLRRLTLKPISITSKIATCYGPGRPGLVGRDAEKG